MDLSDFYKELETKKQLVDEKPPEPRNDRFKSELDETKNGAEGLIYLGEKQKEVQEEHNVVDKMLKDVVNNVTGALHNLIGKFSGRGFGTLVIKLPKSRVSKSGELLDEDGNPIQRYGVKEIENDEQLERLNQNIEIAKMYLPDIEMKQIKTANGKNVTLVTGADSVEFNAVVRAHRQREKLKAEGQMLAEQKKKLMVKMGLNPETGVKGAGVQPANKLVPPQAKEVPTVPKTQARGV